MTKDERNEVGSGRVKKIYDSKVATKYDSTMPPFFRRWKRKAFERSTLKRGDDVLVFCCGTGGDFPYIIEKIGENGRIVGVDFSAEMLRQAKQRVSENGWKNIELIEADVTELKDGKLGSFDSAVCTLGLSIIPDHVSGYQNLISHVKHGGEVIIGDMQLASGFLGIFNPITILMARKYGGTHVGHQNSLEIKKLMKDGLSDIMEKRFFLGAYYFCIGKKG
jgi:demethylmenaquinone methyltransferase/2-methoxy-6-polyprenyl-1,4-benzoquinol methylase